MSAKNTAITFWSRVKINNPSDCWLWCGGKHVQGYGRFKYEGKFWLAHRLAYKLVNSDFDVALDIMHICDNTECVNPKHLCQGTHQENMRDRDNKKRNAFGVGTAAAKLTDKHIRDIRREYALKKTPHSVLAKKYGIAKSGISRIINRYLWKHVA